MYIYTYAFVVDHLPERGVESIQVARAHELDRYELTHILGVVRVALCLCCCYHILIKKNKNKKK